MYYFPEINGKRIQRGYKNIIIYQDVCLHSTNEKRKYRENCSKTFTRNQLIKKHLIEL